MNDSNPSKTLVPRAAGELVHSTTNAGGIRARMTAGALELAQRKALAAAPKLFRIGDYELCAPDFQQVLLWAKELGLTPEALIAAWVNTEPEWAIDTSFGIEHGHIHILTWDFAELPLNHFATQPGMQLHTIYFKGECPEGALHLNIPSLTELGCSCTQLTELDLSAVPQLTELWCLGNQLTELNLSAVPLLASLWCYDNQLTELDLSIVPLLTELKCFDNHLTELDLSAVPLLTNLDCRWSSLTELDLSAVPQLTSLICVDNHLTELDLSTVPLLTGLGCSEDELTELDLSAVPQLTWLDCSDNPLTELDIRPLKHLKQLDVDDHVHILGTRP